MVLTSGVVAFECGVALVWVLCLSGLLRRLDWSCFPSVLLHCTIVETVCRYGLFRFIQRHNVPSPLVVVYIHLFVQLSTVT